MFTLIELTAKDVVFVAGFVPQERLLKTKMATPKWSITKRALVV